MIALCFGPKSGVLAKTLQKGQTMNDSLLTIMFGSQASPITAITVSDLTGKRSRTTRDSANSNPS